MSGKDQEGIGVFIHGHFLCLCLHGFGYRLSLFVLHIELLCELTGTHKVCCCQQFQGSQCRFEPAGGIEAWPEHEADITGSDLVDLCVGNPGK